MNHRSEKRLPGNSKSREQTRRAAPRATVPSEGWDERDFLGTCEKPPVRRILSREEARGRLPRSAVSPGRSRLPIKVLVLDFRERVRILSAFGSHLINECGKGGTRSRVSNNSLPGGIPVQLRQQR